MCGERGRGGLGGGGPVGRGVPEQPLEPGQGALPSAGRGAAAPAQLFGARVVKELPASPEAEGEVKVLRA